MLFVARPSSLVDDLGKIFFSTVKDERSIVSYLIIVEKRSLCLNLLENGSC